MPKWPDNGAFGVYSKDELLGSRDPNELKSERLFFVYYNRGALDAPRRLGYDLAGLHGLHCIPVYRDALPLSENAQVLASCPVDLPIFTDDGAEQSRRPLRAVQGTLLQILGADDRNASTALASFAAAAEDLMAEHSHVDRMQLTCYALQYDVQGRSGTHPAIVFNHPESR